MKPTQWLPHPHQPSALQKVVWGFGGATNTEWTSELEWCNSSGLWPEPTLRSRCIRAVYGGCYQLASENIPWNSLKLPIVAMPFQIIPIGSMQLGLNTFMTKAFLHCKKIICQVILWSLNVSEKQPWTWSLVLRNRKLTWGKITGTHAPVLSSRRARVAFWRNYLKLQALSYACHANVLSISMPFEVPRPLPLQGRSKEVHFLKMCLCGIFSYVAHPFLVGCNALLHHFREEEFGLAAKRTRTFPIIVHWSSVRLFIASMNANVCVLLTICPVEHGRTRIQMYWGVASL